MYYLQMFDVGELGQQVGLVQMGDTYLSVGSAVAAAHSLRLGARFRIPSEGGHVILEDNITVIGESHAA